MLNSIQRRLETSTASDQEINDFLTDPAVVEVLQGIVDARGRGESVADLADKLYNNTVEARNIDNAKDKYNI